MIKTQGCTGVGPGILFYTMSFPTENGKYVFNSKIRDENTSYYCRRSTAV